MRLLHLLRKGQMMSAELIRHQRLGCAATLSKAAAARVIRGVEPESFLMLGMEKLPAAAWGDWMSYFGELEPGLRAINWRGEGKRLTVDKLATAERLTEASIPGPRLLAVIGRDTEAHPHRGIFPHLTTAEAVLDAIPAWPDEVFVKPADGWRGDGILGPERTPSGWSVDARNLADAELAALLIDRATGAGLLVQERLTSSSELHPIGGHLGMGTVRVNTALTDDGPEIVFSFAKIMGSRCLVDNFSGGKFGNMLAQVDIESGRLKRVFGRKPDQRHLMAEVQRHPLTNTPLSGFQLPLWPEVVWLAKRVSQAFPEAPLIGSDIAITPDGPKVIEVQSDWDANGAQLMMGRGLRPVLRKLTPRLAMPASVRDEATQKFRLHSRRSQLQPATRDDRV